MGRFTGILGLLTMLSLAYAFSTNRRAISKKTVAWGLSLQVVFAIFVLKIEFGRRLFEKAGDGVNRLLSYSFEGSKFVFGGLGAREKPMGFFFAFQVLPTVIFIAAFFAVLYHYGIMQFIIKLAAKVMTRFMGASGAESLNVAASIFIGIEPKHLLSAVIMTAPGAILISKMLVPETEVPKTAGRVVMSEEE